VLIFAWLFTNWYSAIGSTLVALAGVLFMPWTTLAWMYTFFHNGGQASGAYVILLIVGVIADLGAYGGGTRYKRWRSAR
jgi:membrane protein YdbS with pleckstrin-like domain